MPTYGYKCKKCGATVDSERLLAENTRHMVDKKVCGTLRRLWQVNVNRSAFRG